MPRGSNEESVADALRAETENADPPTIEQIRAQQPQTFAIPPDEYRAQQVAKIKAEAAELNSDETVPGGRYLVNDQWVDANGDPITQKQAAKDEE